MKNLSYSQEDYLEEIYKQVQKTGQAKVTDISKALDVKKASVTAALINLSQKQLINYAAYAPITLTKEGEEVAREIYEKHQSMTAFFSEILNLSETEASENACKMEHFITDKLYRRFLQLYTFVKGYAVKNKDFETELKKFLS